METIEQVGLASKRRARARTLSGGQLRRLDLALALVGDPDLLFLDEPTTGFDPNARRDAWDMIAGLRNSGTTVLLTSHYLDEVQRLADRVGVMSHGHLVEESTPDALGGRDIAGTVISFRLPAALAGEQLPAGPWDEPEHHDGEIVLRTDQPTRPGRHRVPDGDRLGRHDRRDGRCVLPREDRLAGIRVLQQFGRLCRATCWGRRSALRCRGGGFSVPR